MLENIQLVEMFSCLLPKISKKTVHVLERKKLIYFPFSNWSLGRKRDSNLEACGLFFVIMGHFIFLDGISKFLKKIFF